MELETRKLGILSTAHMPLEDNQILQGLHPSDLHDLHGYMGETEWGWWFSNHLDAENWRAFSLSQTLFDTLTKLFALGYDRIEFDRDGPVFEELPQFNW